MWIEIWGHLTRDCIVTCIFAMLLFNRACSMLGKHDKARWSMTQLEPALLSLFLPSRYLHHQGPSDADGSMSQQPVAGLMQTSTWEDTSSFGAMLISDPATPVNFEAHSSLETLMMIFSPSQLAAQVWCWWYATQQRSDASCPRVVQTPSRLSLRPDLLKLRLAVIKLSHFHYAVPQPRPYRLWPTLVGLHPPGHPRNPNRTAPAILVSQGAFDRGYRPDSCLG